MANSCSSRRTFLKLAAPTVAGALAAIDLAKAATAPDSQPEVWSHEYWAQQGDRKLSMFRKRMGAPKPGERLPALFLAHGSSVSSRSSYDLHVPGHGEYSFMDKFASYGFDVWTMDFEGYGRSSPARGNSNIADGVENLRAAIPVVLGNGSGTRSFLWRIFRGIACGCLRHGRAGARESSRARRVHLHGPGFADACRPRQAA